MVVGYEYLCMEKSAVGSVSFFNAIFKWWLYSHAFYAIAKCLESKISDINLKQVDRLFVSATAVDGIMYT